MGKVREKFWGRLFYLPGESARNFGANFVGNFVSQFASLFGDFVHKGDANVCAPGICFCEAAEQNNEKLACNTQTEIWQ